MQVDSKGSSSQLGYACELCLRIPHARCACAAIRVIQPRRLLRVGLGRLAGGTAWPDADNPPDNSRCEADGLRNPPFTSPLGFLFSAREALHSRGAVVCGIAVGGKRATASTQECTSNPGIMVPPIPNGGLWKPALRGRRATTGYMFEQGLPLGLATCRHLCAQAL